VLAHLPDDLTAVFEVAYITGWRVKSEILFSLKEAGPGIAPLQHVDVRPTDNPPHFLTKPKHPLERVVSAPQMRLFAREARGTCVNRVCL